MNSRITHTMLQRNVLADLNAVSNRLSATQSKIASNKEISKPSDDPYGTTQAMALRQTLAATQQYQRNAQDAAGWQDATETALDEITQDVQRVRNLLVQGASDSTDAKSRESLATEIEQLIQSIKQNANAEYRGSYLFAGSKTDEPPYPMGNADTYLGDDAGWQGPLPRRRARDRPGREHDHQHGRPRVPGRRSDRATTASCWTSSATASRTCAPTTARPSAAPTSSASTRTSTSCSRSAPATARGRIASSPR